MDIQNRCTGSKFKGCSPFRLSWDLTGVPHNWLPFLYLPSDCFLPRRQTFVGAEQKQAHLAYLYLPKHKPLQKNKRAIPYKKTEITV